MLFRHIQSLGARISLATLVLLCAVAQAQAALEADVLDFNEIGAMIQLQDIPDAGGYAGFTWGTAYVATKLTPAPAGVQTYVAFSTANTWILRSDGSDFFFDGADFWSRRAADANGSFYFYLMNDSVVVFDGREDSENRMRFNSTPTFLQSGYSGPIDYMALVFDQGGDDWDHLAMDNFQFRAQAVAVPEPATYLTMAFGLVLVGRSVRRHRYA